MRECDRWTTSTCCARAHVAARRSAGRAPAGPDCEPHALTLGARAPARPRTTTSTRSFPYVSETLGDTTPWGSAGRRAKSEHLLLIYLDSYITSVVYLFYDDDLRSIG